MLRFYLDHQSCTASPLETPETFIENTEAAGSEVFLRLFTGRAKRSPSLHSEEVWRPTAADLICRVEFSHCGFLIIHSSALCIYLFRGLESTRAHVFTFALSDLSVNRLGNWSCLHAGQTAILFRSAQKWDELISSLKARSESLSNLNNGCIIMRIFFSPSGHSRYYSNKIIRAQKAFFP